MQNSSVFSNSSFDIDRDDIIYEIQHCDYEISKYKSDGSLIKTFGKSSFYFTAPNIRKKVDFKRFNTHFELIKKLKALSTSWTKLIDIIIAKNKYLLVILETNNLVNGCDTKYIIDIWDKEGKFIAGPIKTDYKLLCRDKKDFLYFMIYTDEEEALETDPQYKIGKYDLILGCPIK